MTAKQPQQDRGGYCADEERDAPAPAVRGGEEGAGNDPRHAGDASVQGHERHRGGADQDATGDRATFNPETQILRLLGNVTVVNSAGTLNGPELQINLADNTTVFSGGRSGRVTGVFQTQ